MLGAAVRVAQRMGLHDEVSNAKLPALEGELRRRVWWSLILFDARISEMTEFKVGLITPTWTCRPPSSANDFDLQSTTRLPPEVQGMASEALFAVLRSKIGEFTRHSDFHLDFINPALKLIARKAAPGSGPATDELDTLERMIEDKYIRFCDLDNPLHYMTTWWARGQLSKSRFVKYLSENCDSFDEQTDSQRKTGILHALSMLECDTKLMSSDLTRPFRWLVFLHFPFPAYVHVVQALRKRPLGDDAERCWNAMSENCTVRFIDVEYRDNHLERRQNPFFKMFAHCIIQAWQVREAANARLESPAIILPPLIVTQIQLRLARMKEQAKKDQLAQGEGAVAGRGDTNISMSAPMDLGSTYSMGENDLTHSGLEFSTMMGTQSPIGLDTNQWGWPVANWSSTYGSGW
jgi:hypothetical protein